MNSSFLPQRRKSIKVYVGNVPVGGDANISVQSMTNTDTRDVKATLAQIERLADAGCEIVRCAVPDREAANALKEIKKNSPIPLVADIHFNHNYAIKAIKAGCDKIRINPGNIGSRKNLEKVVREARAASIPIRIGINAGSLERDLLRKYGYPSAEALAESALNNVKVMEDLGFSDIVISAKASDVERTIIANRIIAQKVDYPLHLGITEAGGLLEGAIKSSLGLGILLTEGIGDTIRISLTADPENEVRAGFALLRCLKIRDVGIEYISCPTCGRARVDVERILKEVERRTIHIRKPLKVAIMGCAVNGPGEAREADIGVAGGDNEFLLFMKGKPVKKIPESSLIEDLVKIIQDISAE